MKKAILAILLILFAGVLGTSMLGGRTCAYLPLLVGDPPREPSKGGEELTVVSLNMYEAEDVDEILKEFRANEHLRKADIFLLQEVVQRPEGQVSMARKLATALNFYYVFAPIAPRQEGTDRGLAIISRYDIRSPEMIPLKTFNLVFRSRCRGALAATVDTGIGSIRVANVHLDNRLNTDEKLQQLEPVIESAKKYGISSLIGGDFNTGDFFWLSHVVPVPYAQKQTKSVLKEMEKAGFTTPFADTGATYDLLGLRLDWIYLKKLRSREAGIVPVEFSDHHALWVRLIK